MITVFAIHTALSVAYIVGVKVGLREDRLKDWNRWFCDLNLNQSNLAFSGTNEIEDIFLFLHTVAYWSNDKIRTETCEFSQMFRGHGMCE